MSIEKAIDLTEPGPSTKRRRTDDTLNIQDTLTAIDKKLSFLNELGQGFQCIICKSLAVLPVISPCCQRVIGCESCVNNWMAANERCPLCSTEGDVQHRFTLKGFDDTLNLLRITSNDCKDEVQQMNLKGTPVMIFSHL